MIVLPYLAHAPEIGTQVRGHVSSAVVGRTELGSGCSLGELALLRADGEEVRIGPDCWFGEASTVHIADRVYPALVGSHVSVGRYGLVHACTVGDYCLIGMSTTIMDGAVIGEKVVIAAGSLVTPGKQLEGGYLYAGSPVRRIRPLSEEEMAFLGYSAQHYVQLKDKHQQSNQRTG